MSIKKILRGYKPLLYFQNELVLSRGFDVYLSDLCLENIRYVTSVPTSFWQRLFVKNRLMARLLRLGLGPSKIIAESKIILVCAKGRIFRVNMDTGQVTIDFQLPRGARPLVLSEIKVNGFTPGIYFGEYISNPNKNEVNVFRRNADGVWSIAFTFATGTINHVHALIQDLDRNCVYILTGDFGADIGIWRAENNFKNIYRLAAEGQSSRACWVRPHKNRLYYSTDTQLEINHFSSVSIEQPNSSDNNIIIKHFPTTGSSIYCVEGTSDALIFSTAVEPDETSGIKYIDILSTKRGRGIISDCACIYFGTIDDGFSIIMTATKDALPFRLFQFGSFQFPAGVCNDSTLIHTYGVAVKNYDDATILIELSNTNSHLLKNTVN